MDGGRRNGAEAWGAPVDRGAATPLHHQIRLQLRDAILSGRLADGVAAPTERELAARFGVSRITARRALADLAGEGLVTRRRRVGTRVSYAGPAQEPLRADVHQAMDSLIAFGRATRVRLLELSREGADTAACEHLGLSLGDPVVRALRLRLVDAGPLGLVESYAPADVAAGFDREALERAPVLSLVEAAGVRVGSGAQTVTAQAADAAAARLLEVEPGSPLLVIRRVLADEAGRRVLVTVARYRADRYELHLDLGAH